MSLGPGESIITEEGHLGGAKKQEKIATGSKLLCREGSMADFMMISQILLRVL